MSCHDLVSFSPLRSLDSSSPTLLGKEVVFRSSPVLYDLLKKSACRLCRNEVWVAVNRNRMSRPVVYEKESEREREREFGNLKFRMDQLDSP